MKEQTNNKTKWLHVRLSEDEYNKIQSHFKRTTCRKLSEYTRKKLLDEHVITYYRNQSLDDLMTELMPMRKSQNAVSNNFNQAVRKLNSMRQNDDAAVWIIAWERDEKRLIIQVEEIKNHIQIFAEQWLQNSIQTRPSGKL